MTTTNDFSFDDIEADGEILQEFVGSANGDLTIRRAKPREGSNALALNFTFVLNNGTSPRPKLLGRIQLRNRDGSTNFEAGSFKREIEPFLKDAGLPGTLENVCNLFTNFPCYCTFSTDSWTDSEGNLMKNIKLKKIQKEAEPF